MSRGFEGAIVISVTAALEHWGQRIPHELALVCGDDAVTWTQLVSRSRALARALQKAGVQAGDLVGLNLPNGTEAFIATAATWRLGAVPLPLPARLPAHELEAVMTLAHPRLVVSQGELPASFAPSMTYSHLQDLDSTGVVLREADPPCLKAALSSGSTGRPKLIVSRAAASIDPDVAPFLMRVRGAHLLCGPIYHSAPYTFAIHAVTRGNCIVMQPRFDAEQTLRLIEAHRIDWTFMVPTMMHRIWKLPENLRRSSDLSSLAVLAHAGSFCPAWLKQHWIEWLGPARVHEFYGGTEAQGGTWITGDEWLAHPGSVGRATPGCALRILDESGAPVPAGQIGEIYLRPDTGQGTTYTYIGAQPRATSDGFESLGDMGHLDDDGYLYIADRRTDLILRGGENVYPAEVEAALLEHPGIASAAVVGLPDADLGQRVHAIVQPISAVSPEELAEFLAPRLSRYKIPQSFEFVMESLTDERGKMRRSALTSARSR